VYNIDMPDNNLEKQIYKTYLQMVKNSEGCRLFNSLYVKELDTGKEYDIYDDGVLSGAFYVSSVLTLLGLMDKPHSTTDTIKKIFEDKKDKDWGWEIVSKNDLKAGDVIFWEEIIFDDGTKSDQVGFYIDDTKAYSTGATERCVIKHHPTFGQKPDGTPARKIIAAYRNKNI
jgi:hypothetical protein